MTLGDIIKEYLEEHTVNEFIRDSGISKAYTYNLINNKGTNGAAPTPTIETINKVARGVHSDFDTIFTRLDPDIILSTKESRPHAATREEAQFKRMTAHYHFSERQDGSIIISLKEPYKSLMSPEASEIDKKLLDAANGCTPQQKQVAIDMLNAFKNGK